MPRLEASIFSYSRRRVVGRVQSIVVGGSDVFGGWDCVISSREVLVVWSSGLVVLLLGGSKRLWHLRWKTYGLAVSGRQ